jgi:RNA polymerase sigma factor (sigma-70 family)
MSPFDSKTNTPPEQVLVTTSGVRVTVKAPPPPPPPRPPAAAPRPLHPMAIVLPAAQPARDRAAFLKGLCDQHYDFVKLVLLRRGDVLAASVPDVAQDVIVILWRYIQGEGSPANVRGFLVDVIDKEVANRKRKARRRPAVDHGANADDTAADAPDPEEAVDTVQHMDKVQRCMESLSHEEAEAIRYIELLEATLEKTSAQLNRPLSTVAAQHTRGMKKLKALANDPEE